MKDLNVKYKTIKLLGRNISGFLQELGKEFLDLTPKEKLIN